MIQTCSYEIEPDFDLEKEDKKLREGECKYEDY